MPASRPPEIGRRLPPRPRLESLFPGRETVKKCWHIPHSSKIFVNFAHAIWRRSFFGMRPPSKDLYARWLPHPPRERPGSRWRGPAKPHHVYVWLNNGKFESFQDSKRQYGHSERKVRIFFIQGLHEGKGSKSTAGYATETTADLFDRFFTI